MNTLELVHAGTRYTALLDQACDLAVPVQFNHTQVHAFGAPPARSEALSVEGFVGAVERGGSCNCHTLHFTPHCNGTHTECAGHLTREHLIIHSVISNALHIAQLISVVPEPLLNAGHEDQIITASQLQHVMKHDTNVNAVVIRTLPNPADKRWRDYDAGPMPAYFEPAALQWLASQGIDHLLCDLPSVDRMHDDGLLLAHRAFWGLPAGVNDLAAVKRRHATITELIYVPDTLVDGLYLLNLQVAAFDSDAAPSRPLLYPLLKI